MVWQQQLLTHSKQNKFQLVQIWYIFIYCFIYFVYFIYYCLYNEGLELDYLQSLLGSRIPWLYIPVGITIPCPSENSIQPTLREMDFSPLFWHVQNVCSSRTLTDRSCFQDSKEKNGIIEAMWARGYVGYARVMLPKVGSEDQQWSVHHLSAVHSQALRASAQKLRGI